MKIIQMHIFERISIKIWKGKMQDNEEEWMCDLERKEMNRKIKEARLERIDRLWDQGKA